MNMKKMGCAVLAAAMLFGGVSALAETAENTVDAYTSASLSKTTLAGDDLAAAVELLVANSSDLATKAETLAEGYVAQESHVAQLLSINPDACVGVSTISEWKYVPSENGNDCLMMELNAGQQTANLSKPNARGSLLAILDGMCYLVHFKVVDADEQVFTKEAYEAGEFDKFYGENYASRELSSFSITTEVLCIERFYGMFN